jgi:hypothetical protein
MSMPCVIFDIDGTIADIGHRRHHVAVKPKNWPAFKRGIPNDEPNHPVCRVASNLFRAGNHLIYCSGRGEDEREATLNWFTAKVTPKYGIYMLTQHLYMRPAKDNRSDDIIKRELLQKIRADGYQPWIAFDDRDRVVAMWRSEGITCCQVAEGNF